MVYKKYLKKGGKIFGPYYYESYRSGENVKKHYIGSEKEYKKWLKNKKQEKKVEQLAVSKKTFNIGMLMFLISLIALIFIIGIILGYFFNVSSLIMVGFAVSPNTSYAETNSALLYGDYKEEGVVEQFDTETIDLEIKNPTKFAGEAISKNKNKRMDFNVPEGKIRLYFDLLNYSEFVNKVQNIVVAEEVEKIEKEKAEPVIEINIIIREENLTEPVENVTEESVENISEIIETPIKENITEEIPIEENITEEIPVEEATEEPVVIGNVIKGVTGFVARIIGFAVEEQPAVNETLVEGIRENINVDDIKEKVKELSEDKIDSITEDSIAKAESFEVNVTNAEKDNYKWGYKIKLNELNFMAKIDITTNQSIYIYNNDTLRIGNNLLSFNDLVKAGYTVKIEKPVLESSVSNVSIIETNIIIPEEEIKEISEENITGFVENITETNITEPVENVTEEINITEEILVVEENITEEVVPEAPVEEVTEEPTITGNIIKGLAGIYKLTGKAVDEQGILIEETEIKDIKYENLITVYIEKDFNEYNKLIVDQNNLINIETPVKYEDIDNSGDVSIGDIIFLDPSLTIIEISKAEHLDENRSFISDIYNDVKEKDNNWSEVINNSEYVRVTFNQSLTNQNDITIYARASNYSNEFEECYDNETQVLTENGWKYFYELTGNEKVATLNQNTKKIEWQLPSEYQEFNNDKEMYKIELEDGSDLLVSEKHKVYVGENREYHNNLNSLIKSFVENISISDCSLNASSSDQIGVLSNNKDKAKYGSSSIPVRCGDILLASERNLEYLDFSNVLTDFFNKENKKSNSDSSSSENLIILSLFSDSSFKTKSGEIKTQSLLSNSSITYLLTDSDLKNENNIDASTINDFGSIFDYSSCCLATFCFNSLASFEICSSVNLLLDNISSAIENSTLLTSCFTTLSKANANLSLSSSGTSTLITTSAISEFNEDAYLNVSNFSLQLITETYEDINNGKEIYFLDAENNPVRVKSIEKQDYNDKIYDVDVENDIVLVRRNSRGKLGRAVWSGNSNPVTTSIEVYRKDDNNSIAKFENITQENWYKIYLSNLSENESYDVFDLKIIGGNQTGVEFDYIVDPTIAENVVASSSLVNITAETGNSNFTHLNISTIAPYNSLILYYPFDGDKENTKLTTHYDFSRYNKDRTGVGDVVVNNTNCIYGDCARFDGDGDYVDVGNIITYNYTLCGWVKPQDRGASSQIIFDLNTGTGKPYIRIIGGAIDQFIIYLEDTAYLYSSSTVSYNAWQHVCFYISENITNNHIYLNGAVNEGSSVKTTLGSAIDDFEIGTSNTAGMDFNGTIDEVMIFNTSLTSDQILAIYNNQSARFLATGTQDIVNQSYMNITSGNNRVNVTTYIESLLGSSINLTVGFYNTSNSWFYTTPQVVSSGAVQIFNISSTSTNLTLNYTFFAGNSTNPFYSPIIQYNITYTAWNAPSACGNLNVENSTYTLLNNVTSTGTCFNITANNITLNCQGYEIKYSSNGGNYEYGVYSTYNFTTIKNCFIKEDLVAGDYDYAIYFDGAKNGTINNNTITTSGISSYGIRLDSNSNSNTLSNNKITTSGSSGHGIELYTSSTNTLSNNTITTSESSSYGIELYTSSTNTLSNNTITTFGDSGYGIYLFSNTNNNSFSGMNIKTKNSKANSIHIYDTNHNFTITDSILNSSGSSLVKEFYVRSAVTGGTWNFTNVTRADGNPITTSWTAGANGTLIMMWYYRAYVNDTSGLNVSGANVTAYSVTGSYQFNLTTDSTGYTGLGEIIDYVRNGTTTTYYSNYTIYAINSSYFTGSHTYNATLKQSNYKDVFTLSMGTNVTSCGVLDQANTVYTQTANIVKSSLYGECISITAENITYNGNGYSLTNPASGGRFFYSTQKNTTIKNCNMSSLNTNGIKLYNANNSYIFNNTLSAIYSDNALIGIILNRTSNARIENNTLSHYDQSITAQEIIGYRAIYPCLSESHNNIITGNSISYGSGEGQSLAIKLCGNNNTVEKNIVNNIMYEGVLINNGSYNLITENTLTSCGYGVHIIEGLGNNISHNMIDLSVSSGPPGGGGANGIKLEASSRSNYFFSDTIIAYEADSKGIFANSSNNIFDGEGIGSPGYCIYINNGSNNLLKNFYFYTCGLNVTLDSTSVNNTFLNLSYPEDQYETVSSGSQLIRKWYYRAYVNDTSNNNMSGANITAYNTTGSSNIILTTDSTGYTGLGEIIDYINNGTLRVYYSNYTIYAGNSSWPYLNHSFNVTSQGTSQSGRNNYKDVFTFSQTVIPLVSGWNLIGLSMHNTDTGTNKNITVANNSWSLIAYSANVSTNLSDINFVNSSGNSVNWSTAVSQSKVQAYLVYRENNVFKYVSTPEIPMQDTALRQNKGYWIKVRAMNGTANLSIPGVGGSLSGQAYDWSKLRFSDGTKDLNITEASGANYNWTQAAMYYYGFTGLTYDYMNICGTGDCDKTTISSWEGYWIWSNQNNINLIRRN